MFYSYILRVLVDLGRSVRSVGVTQCVFHFFFVEEEDDAIIHSFNNAISHFV